MDYLHLLTVLVAVVHLSSWPAETDAAQLNDYILDYQPLQFNPLHLHEKHNRVKRSVDPYLRWNFKAYGRTFNIRLSPANSVFTKDHTLDMDEDGPIPVDTSFIYEGHLTDNPNSRVHMSVLNNSILGFIHIPGHNTYHIEPAHKHFKQPQYPSIIYPESRMNLDPYRHKRAAAVRENSACGTQAIFEKLRENSQPAEPFKQKRRKRKASHEHDKYSAYYNAEKLSRKRRSLISGLDTCFLHLRADKLLYDHIFGAQGSEQKAKEEILAMFAVHVAAITQIYEESNFVLLSDPAVSYRGMRFQLQRSTVMKNCDLIDNGYCTDNLDVSNFLELTSQADHSEFCLVHTFTYRDFIGGTLGLAWVATTTSGNAGVCGQYQNVRNSDGQIVRKSLNTGITTLINFKQDVPSRVSQLTFAHEVGHNYGSQHDQTAVCAPYGTSQSNSADGNYIMFPSANQGNFPNNDKFSECSRDSIAKVLETMADNPSTDDNPMTIRKYCFNASDAAFCGNNLVEGDEECDCGYEGECSDACCNPRPTTGKNNEMCTRKVTAVCSPSEGKCCDDACEYEDANTICQAAGDCTDESVCLGNNATCPKPPPKSDTTFCNDNSATCKNGECIGSICDNIQWIECSQGEEDVSDKKELCFIACMKPNTSECISSNNQEKIDANPEFKSLLQDIQNRKMLTGDDLSIKKRAGDSCNFGKGYCDILSNCRRRDAEGPFKQLTDMIFDSVSFDRIEDWITDHWWAVLLMAIGVCVFMGLFIKIFGYNTPSEDPKKKRMRENQSAARPRAQPQQQPDKRKRPPEREAVYATDLPMYDRRDHGASRGHTNLGYVGQEGSKRNPAGYYNQSAAYPNYRPSQQGRPRGQQFDRIAGPYKY